MKVRRNFYTHEIDLQELKIKNEPKDKFVKQVEKIKYRGYKVEDLSDGRKIVITKPGGKFTYGTVKRDDHMVFVFDPKDNSLWLISHKDIYMDLEEKGKLDPVATVAIINLLERVYNGEDPDDILSANVVFPSGEPPEVLLKVYKWIWVQEDINYPNGEGRLRSFKGIAELRDKISV